MSPKAAKTGGGSAKQRVELNKQLVVTMAPLFLRRRDTAPHSACPKVSSSHGNGPASCVPSGYPGFGRSGIDARTLRPSPGSLQSERRRSAKSAICRVIAAGQVRLWGRARTGTGSRV